MGWEAGEDMNALMQAVSKQPVSVTCRKYRDLYIVHSLYRIHYRMFYNETT